MSPLWLIKRQHNDKANDEKVERVAPPLVFRKVRAVHVNENVYKSVESVHLPEKLRVP